MSMASPRIHSWVADFAINLGNYIPVVPDYLSKANISFFFKKPKIFAIKNQVFIDFFRIAYYL